MHLNRKDQGAAFYDFSRAIELDPTDPWPFVFRSKIHFDRKNYNLAIKDSTSAIELAPEDADAHLLRGRGLLETKDYEKAYEDLHKAAELNPKDNIAQYYLANVAVGLQKKDAAYAARMSLDLEPAQKPTATYSAVMGWFGSMQLGRNDNARWFLEQAKTKCDKANWPYPLIRFLDGEIDERTLSKLAQDDTAYVDARVVVGLVLSMKGQRKKATEAFQAARLCKPNEVVFVHIAYARLK